MSTCLLTITVESVLVMSWMTQMMTDLPLPYGAHGTWSYDPPWDHLHCSFRLGQRIQLEGASLAGSLSRGNWRVQGGSDGRTGGGVIHHLILIASRFHYKAFS